MIFRKKKEQSGMIPALLSSWMRLSIYWAIQVPVRSPFIPVLPL